MPNPPTLPTEITLQIARCMFLQAGSSARASPSRHTTTCSYKPPWHDVASLTLASSSMRRFALRLWFSTFVLRKTSDLKVGLDIFPNLTSCINASTHPAYPSHPSLLFIPRRRISPVYLAIPRRIPAAPRAAFASVQPGLLCTPPEANPARAR
ncbi:hypothetical protein BDV93DRAFT_280763 [Ceratobasidium sp. AG-I]|nr:hypothetical protein BDV93DRAFT_280763 [Ceratobasidium sp. AG-I]